MSKVTVIMAAYNAADYIRQSIDSLLRQTKTDMEVICVDDASTDNTPEILHYYAEADHRIKVVRLPENVGQAKARNVAVDMATGDYICMLDSDDWMSEDALERAASVLDDHPQADTVLFQVVEVYDDHDRKYPLPMFVAMTGQQAFEASLTWQLHGLYMIRTGIHKRYPFDDTSRAYSDDNTTRIHYLHSREVRQCEGIYYYRQHPGSVTHAVSVRRFDYLRANESMRRQIMEAHVDARLIAVYEHVRWLNLIDTYMFYYHHRKQLSAADREYGLAEMKRVWGNIDMRQLPKSLCLKPGYVPLRPFWTLFRIQEEAYFFLRKTLKGR